MHDFCHPWQNKKDKLSLLESLHELMDIGSGQSKTNANSAGVRECGKSQLDNVNACGVKKLERK